MKFMKAAVLGTGTLPLFAAGVLREKGLSVTVYDMDEKTSGLLKRRAQAESLSYEHSVPKELFKSLSLEKDPILVVSAINPYILPGYLLSNPAVTAINCHQALLPRHPGRNAEMWAIFEEDTIAGITWHVLTNEVDAGDILIQKSFPLTEKHTAYLVFREQILLAEEAFSEILPGLLSGSLRPVPQEKLTDRKLHYSRDLPNNGFLNPDWDAKKTSAFLRSMDYSILSVVPKPRIQIQEGCFTWKKYKITGEHRFSDGIIITDSSIFIQKPELLFELCNYQKENLVS